MGNTKLGNANIDSIMVDSARSVVKGDTMFKNTDVSNYYLYALDAGGYRVSGLWLAPFRNRTYPWPWDLGVPGGALKYPNNGWSNWGHLNDGKDLNITENMNTSFPDNGWGSSGWKVAITFWTGVPNSDNSIDFGESPITIHFKDDRFDNVVWEVQDGATATVSQDKRTITVYSVPISSHTALVGTYYSDPTDSSTIDTSISRVRQLLTNVIVDLHGMDYHHNTFTVGYPTSIESYKACIGDTVVWNKAETFDNCWKKHGVAIPISYPSSMTMSNATCSDMHFINPLKSAIKSNFSLTWPTITSWGTYTYISAPNVKIKLDNAVVGTTITMNLVIDKGTADGQRSWFNNSTTLSGTSGELQFLQENALLVWRASGDDRITWHYEISIQFPQGATPTDYAVVEIIPTDTLYSIRSGVWPGYSWLAIPFIEDFTGNVKIQTNIYNSDFWNGIKQWYSTNTYNKDCFESGEMFKDSNLSGELTLNLPSDGFLYGADNFRETGLTKITFVKPDNSTYYSSPQKLFGNARDLIDIDIVWANGETGERFLCGANNIGGMFGSCERLQTYPSELIKWNEYRSNSVAQTIPCTLCDYAFERSGLIEIPSYGNNRFSDNNTIVCANYCIYMFLNCSKLTKIGPVLDCRILLPSNATLMFKGCDNLTDVRIKNLNHGDWDFADYGSGSKGNFSNLDLDSIEYLIDNLANLNGNVPGYDYNANPNNSFLSWDSSYKNAAAITPYWDYTMYSAMEFLCRKRYGDVNNAACIAKTTFRTDTAIPTFEVSGLNSTDQLWLVSNNTPIAHFDGDGSSTPVLVTIPANTYNVEFRLVGDPTDTSQVSINLVGGLDWSIPRSSVATLYLPAACKTKLIDAGTFNSTRWTNKGWTIKDENGNVWSNT